MAHISIHDLPPNAQSVIRILSYNNKVPIKDIKIINYSRAFVNNKDVETVVVKINGRIISRMV